MTMKRIFTFIFALFVASASVFAQSLTLSHRGVTVNCGDTVEVMVPQLNSGWDEWVDLTNVSDENVRVKVYKNELNLLNGASVQFCFGGLCYSSSASESVIVSLAADSTISQANSEDAFHLTYKTSVAGTSFVEFIFANEDNADDYVSMVFKLVYDPTSIVNAPVATKMFAYPNPASDNVTIEYAYTGNASKVSLVIKNLVGSTIYTKNLDANGNKIRVDVSEYNAGIYFYSIEADGRPLVTKKLLVK